MTSLVLPVMFARFDEITKNCSAGLCSVGFVFICFMIGLGFRVGLLNFDHTLCCLQQVLKDLGLCVTLYDIKNIDGGFVFPGDGAPHFTVGTLSSSTCQL